MSKKTRNRNIEIIVHALVWMIIFVLPNMLVFRGSASDNQHRVLTLLGGPLSLAFVFYINYLFLVPRILMGERKRRRRFFALANVILYFVALVGMNAWIESTKIKHNVRKPQKIELSVHPSKMVQSPADAPFHNKANPHDVQFDDRANASGLQWWLFQIRDISLFFLVTLLALLMQRSNRWAKANNARKEAEIKQAEAEVKMLINQVSPHFLLNTLNNIYALIAIDTDKAQKAIKELSNLLHYMLYENRNEFTTIGNDVTFIQRYIDLMKLRLSKNIDVQTQINIGNAGSVLIVPLLIIPLVENAFKHGVSNTEFSFVHITITATEKSMYCRVENSNHPKTQSDRSGSGIGMEMIRSRLEASYPNRYKWTHEVSVDKKTYLSELTINF